MKKRNTRYVATPYHLRKTNNYCHEGKFNDYSNNYNGKYITRDGMGCNGNHRYLKRTYATNDDPLP